MEDDDDVSDLDLEALEQEALAEATSRSELARAALSQESTPDMPWQKQVAAPSATQGQTTLVIAAK